jgi:hypothetical protein
MISIVGFEQAASNRPAASISRTSHPLIRASSRSISAYRLLRERSDYAAARSQQLRQRGRAAATTVAVLPLRPVPAARP